jgi:acetyl-CoA carboxylase carboxyl transferase subunit beta
MPMPMLNNLIKRTKKYATANPEAKKAGIPEGMYLKCPSCKKSVYKPDLKVQIGVCPQCSYYYPLSSRARIAAVTDRGTFIELDKELTSGNPLDFPDYEKKLESYMAKTDQKEAVITGTAEIEGQKTVIGVMDSRFMMGSMGSVVGEKLTRAIEYATEYELPLIIFTASGGARMQEGIFSLMQMAKTSAALARHDENGQLYISVLTDPTTGGVTASFAMLGDIILAEPGALIGFAGPRVIEQTIKQKLPEGFQRSEFLLEHGMIDAIVKRQDMKETLGRLLKLHQKEEK